MNATVFNATIRVIDNFESKKWDKVRRQWYFFGEEERNWSYAYIEDNVPDPSKLLKFLTTVEQYERTNG